MGRNSKRTLLGTIALVMLFALTAYAADITYNFHIAKENVGYNSAKQHKNEKTLHADLLLAGITQLVTVLVADKIHQHQYIRSLKPLIA